MQRSIVAGLVVGLAVTMVTAAGASAQTGAETAVNSITPTELADTFASAGFAIEATRTPDGDPRLDGQSASGINFSVYFYDCTRAKAPACARVQFRASFSYDPSLATVDLNAFNRAWVFGKAYRYEDGDLAVELPVMLDGGVTQAHLAEQVMLWEAILGDWTDHIGWWD